MTMLPEFCRALATRQGIPSDHVDDLWVRHVRWCEQNGRREFGGKPWKSLVDLEAERLREMVVLSQQEAEQTERRAQARMVEQQRQHAADDAYDRDAVSFAGWIESLMKSEETLSPHEDALCKASTPPKHVALGAWLLDALADSHAARSPRQHPCPGTAVEPCGLPCRSWVREGRRYHASRCASHEEQLEVRQTAVADESRTSALAPISGRRP
jgi:hypothetical protein